MIHRIITHCNQTVHDEDQAKVKTQFSPKTTTNNTHYLRERSTPTRKERKNGSKWTSWRFSRFCCCFSSKMTERSPMNRFHISIQRILYLFYYQCIDSKTTGTGFQCFEMEKHFVDGSILLLNAEKDRTTYISIY